MLVIKILASFIKALNEKASPGALAGGFALGSIIGLTPKGSLHNAVIFLLIFLLPVNKAASLVTAGLFSLVAYAGDPLFNLLGETLLTAPSLLGFWTWCYNTPVVAWTGFNHTLTLGSLVSSAVLFVPLFFSSRKFVVLYRDSVVAAASKWKVVQTLKATKIFVIYNTLA